MESFRDPFNALTVVNTVGGVGFAIWTFTKLKENSDNQKELCNKVEDLTKIVKELQDFMSKGRHNFAVLDGNQQKLTKELKVLQKKIDNINLESEWALEALRKLEKFEKTKDRDFKLPRRKKSGKSKYESDSGNDSDTESSESEKEDRRRRPNREDKDEEPQMRRPRKPRN